MWCGLTVEGAGVGFSTSRACALDEQRGKRGVAFIHTGLPHASTHRVVTTVRVVAASLTGCLSVCWVCCMQGASMRGGATAGARAA